MLMAKAIVDEPLEDKTHPTTAHPSPCSGKPVSPRVAHVPPEHKGLGSPESGGCPGCLVAVNELWPEAQGVTSAIREHWVDRK